MKTFNCLAVLALPLAIMVAFLPNVRGANPERVLFKEGQVWVVQNGTSAALTGDIDLPNDIVVFTNGTFKVGAYTPRAFEEGQSLGWEGMLTSANGRIEPVIDHVAMDA